MYAPFALALARPALYVSLAFALTACAACSDDEGDLDAYEPPASESLGDLNTAENFAADMHAPHEGHPRGFDYADVPPQLEWILRPRVGMGAELPEGWNATIPWGQVYADTTVASSGAGLPEGVRFQLRNIQQWILRKSTNRWERISRTDDITGANYAEDFQDDVNVEADIRSELTRGGGISATVVDGYNFHFFPRSRTEVDPADIAEIWSSFEGRLVADEGVDPAVMADARVIADVGGDYWESTAAAWDQWTTNGDWGIGRFKYLTPEWQVFNCHTLGEDELALSPFATP